MSFLDDFENRVNTSADIRQLQSDLMAEERYKADICYQIGLKYLELHKEDPEEEYAELFRLYQEAEERNEERRRLIRTIKGLVVCPNCGAEMPNTIGFCTNCGKPMPRPEPPKTTGRFCRFCGTQLTEEAKFCPKCGQPCTE